MCYCGASSSQVPKTATVQPWVHRALFALLIVSKQGLSCPVSVTQVSPRQPQSVVGLGSLSVSLDSILASVSPD